MVGNKNCSNMQNTHDIVSTEEEETKILMSVKFTRKSNYKAKMKQ
jgi:hypothetical protein